MFLRPCIRLYFTTTTDRATPLLLRLRHRRTRLALLLSVIPIILLVGCSQSTPSATSASTSTVAASVSRPPASVRGTPAVCVFLSRIDRAASQAKSEDQGLRILKSFSPQFATELKAVPSWAASDLPIVIRASRQALETNDLTVLSTDAVAAAGARLSKGCGLKG